MEDVQFISSFCDVGDIRAISYGASAEETRHSVDHVTEFSANIEGSDFGNYVASGDYNDSDNCLFLQRGITNADANKFRWTHKTYEKMD